MKNFNIYILLFLMCFISNCDVILEPDISNIIVPLKSPGNNFTSTQESQTFWWDFVAGATFYNIQIVSPSFDAVQQLITDSEVETNTFEQSLPPGEYEWTVIAYNNSYVSKSEIYKLTIEEATTLENQTVLLVAPINNTIINNNPTRLLWQTLSIAENYAIQIATPDFTNSIYIVSEDTTTNDYFDILDLTDGTYQWRVKALNSNSSTEYTEDNFTVDRTPPTNPILNSPNDGSTFFLNNNITLSWTSSSDAVQDTLFITRDLGQSDEVVLTLPTLDQTYTFIDSTSTNSQTYFWQIKSVDVVGNVSTSSSREFYVQ